MGIFDLSTGHNKHDACCILFKYNPSVMFLSVRCKVSHRDDFAITSNLEVLWATEKKNLITEVWGQPLTLHQYLFKEPKKNLMMHFRITV